MLKKELGELFRNRKLLISFLAVLFIPIMYSGMFLWAFWDPYDRLEDLPVAIINNDKGTELDGEKYELGKEFTDKLKESKEFNFQFVDRKTGYKDLKDQEYYLLVEVPENFSENAATLLDKHPKKLELKYVPNESYNFLSAQIGETAIEKIKSSLSQKVTETYAETMFDNVEKMADGFKGANEGAGKLHAGIDEVNTGAKTLQEKLQLFTDKQLEFKNGTDQVSSGSKELANGTESLAGGLGQLSDAQAKLLAGAKSAQEGTGALKDGIDQTASGIAVIEGKMGEINSGTNEVKKGADTLTSSLNELQAGAETAAQGASDLNSGAAALEEQLSQIMPMLPPEQQEALKGALGKLNEGTAGLAAGNKNLAESAGKIASGSASLSANIGKIGDGQAALKQGLSQLNEGAGKLQNGAGSLADGQSQLTEGLAVFGDKLKEAKSGADQLVSGSKSLSDGAAQLSGGSAQLAEGSGQLAEGSKKITGGTDSLSEGSKELKDKLGEAAKESSKVKGTDETYDMVAEPVKVDKESLNHVPNYGTGFAPYFLSLGLFVGALLLSIVFPLREPAGTPKSGFSWFFSKFGILAAAGVIQALLAAGLTLALLGMEVQSIPRFFLFAIITSLTFMGLIQLLVTVLGDPGRFIAIVILILQLTTSAGTFPLELIPAPLQVFNDLLPMTYSVRGFKEVISSGNFSLMWQNAAILGGYLAAFMALTLTFFTIVHKRRFSGSEPEKA